MSIKFIQEGGFAGQSYFLLVDGKWYQLCTNLGGIHGENEARMKAKEVLKSLNIEYTEDIVFKHGGAL